MNLKDPAYLDPNGVNRRFIILTPAQADLPVVHTQFSNTSQLMYEFFSSNARAINTLTIKDVLYGEIEDSVSIVTGYRGSAFDQPGRVSRAFGPECHGAGGGTAPGSRAG